MYAGGSVVGVIPLRKRRLGIIQRWLGWLSWLREDETDIHAQAAVMDGLDT